MDRVTSPFYSLTVYAPPPAVTVLCIDAPRPRTEPQALTTAHPHHG